jgi:hypothetical protein
MLSRSVEGARGFNVDKAADVLQAAEMLRA